MIELTLRGPSNRKGAPMTPNDIPGKIVSPKLGLLLGREPLPERYQPVLDLQKAA